MSKRNDKSCLEFGMPKKEKVNQHGKARKADTKKKDNREMWGH